MKNLFLAMAISIAFISTIQLISCEKSCTGGCQNGGSCDNKTGTCNCPSGYSGESCQTAANAQFVGTYNIANAVCPGGSWTGGSGGPNGQIIISAQTNPTAITIAISGQDILTGNVTGTTVNISSQSFSDGSTYSGSGTLSGSTLTLSIAEVDQYGGFTCTLTGVN